MPRTQQRQNAQPQQRQRPSLWNDFFRPSSFFNDPFFSDPWQNFDTFQPLMALEDGSPEAKQQVARSAADGTVAHPSGQTWGSWMQQPAMHVKETETNYFVDLDVPGVSKTDMKLDLDETRRRITISGERKEETGDKSKGNYSSRFGSFSRSFTVPKDVIMSDIAANHVDGVLKIQMPRDGSAAAEKGPRSIDIQ